MAQKNQNAGSTEIVVEVEVKTLFARIVEATKIEDAAAKELALELLEKECNENEALKIAITGKWVLDNDPAILNAHQVREQAVILVAAPEVEVADEE